MEEASKARDGGGQQSGGLMEEASDGVVCHQGPQKARVSTLGYSALSSASQAACQL
jgi:hypothetical protein